MSWNSSSSPLRTPPPSPPSTVGASTSLDTAPPQREIPMAVLPTVPVAPRRPRMPFSQLREQAAQASLKRKYGSTHDDDASYVPVPKKQRNPVQVAKYEREKSNIKEPPLPGDYQAIFIAASGGLWQCPVLGCHRGPENPIKGRRNFWYHINSGHRKEVRENTFVDNGDGTLTSPYLACTEQEKTRYLEKLVEAYNKIEKGGPLGFKAHVPQPTSSADHGQTGVKACVEQALLASATENPTIEPTHNGIDEEAAAPQTSDDTAMEKMAKELKEVKEANARLVVASNDLHKRLGTAEEGLKTKKGELTKMGRMFKTVGGEVAYLEIVREK